MENQAKTNYLKIGGGIAVLLLIISGYFIFKQQPKAVIQDKPLTPAEQVQEMTKLYNKEWDKANGIEIELTGKQPDLIVKLNENISGIVGAKYDKCFHSGMTSKITNYFKESFKVPTGDVIVNMQKESEAGCVRDTIFTQVKSDIVKVLDGNVQNNSVAPQAAAATFPALSQ